MIRHGGARRRRPPAEGFPEAELEAIFAKLKDTGRLVVHFISDQCFILAAQVSEVPTADLASGP
jgi:hypothetical protein